jgi:transposase
MVSDAHWMRLEPLIEACRPKGKTPPKDLRRTISAILWRHQNGAKWRAIPAELGPWWRAAQIFIRWARRPASEVKWWQETTVAPRARPSQSAGLPTLFERPTRTRSSPL